MPAQDPPPTLGAHDPSVAVPPLSLNELCALHNLANKRDGDEVDWINIADACALTALGLARRTRSGWEITTEGDAVVKASPEAEKRPKLVGIGPCGPGEFDS
jgi:hypothetical protein